MFPLNEFDIHIGSTQISGTLCFEHISWFFTKWLYIFQISYGAYFFVFLANAVIFSSIYGIYKYFRGDFEGASMF